MYNITELVVYITEGDEACLKPWLRLLPSCFKIKNSKDIVQHRINPQQSECHCVFSFSF